MNMAALQIDPSQSIGQIAVNLPGATAIFRRLKLDFCCGGQVPLVEAVAAKGVNLDVVVKALSALERADEPTAPTEPDALVAHILTRYHAVHREQLPELIAMARRVEAVHKGHPDVPVGLAYLLEDMAQYLNSHMAKEETVLFPLLTTGGHALAGMPMKMMRSEHTDHGESLDRLLALTNDAIAPLGACNTWRALYAGIDQFRDDLINHIHLENNVLFPHFEHMQADAASGSGCGGGGCRYSGG